MPADLHVVLYEPDIPSNTGTIARLCLATGATLHLVGRLGFQLDDRRLRRAGLDYWRHVQVVRHLDWETCQGTAPRRPACYFSAHATRPYTASPFPRDAWLVFGSETRGLPAAMVQSADSRRIPLFDSRVRSLNLAVAVGIVVYEAIRQRECVDSVD